MRSGRSKVPRFPYILKIDVYMVCIWLFLISSFLYEVSGTTGTAETITSKYEEKQRSIFCVPYFF